MWSDPDARFRTWSSKGRDAPKPNKRFADEQVTFALRQTDGGAPVGEICRKLGVSEATFHRWKKVYAGMGVGEIRRLKQLDDEHGKLERLVAEVVSRDVL